MIVKIIIVTSLLMFPAGAAQAPDLSPAALMRAFAQIGFQVGVIRTIEDVTVRVDALRVEADGRWIVIRVLPKRIRGH